MKENIQNKTSICHHESISGTKGFTAESSASVQGSKPPVPTKGTGAHNQNAAVPPVDKICYESGDGQIRIEQLVMKAKKYPPSPYPCIVLTVKPEDHTRVRRIWGGYVEVMPSYREMEMLVDSMNNAALASGKGKLYEVLQRIPEKTAEHKQRWKKFNEARLRRPWGKRPRYWHQAK